MIQNNSTEKENSFYKKVVFNPWKVIGLCLLIVFFVGSFMRFVAPSVTYKDMLGEDYPLLKGYEQIQSEYTNDDNLLVLIEAKDGDAFTQNILVGVQELTKTLWQTPHSIRVDSVTNFQHTQANGDDLKVGDLVGNKESLTKTELARIKGIALSEPALLNRAVNLTGRVLAINVSFAFPNLALEEKLGADDFVQQAVKNFRKNYPETNVYVAGLVALDATVMKISQKESGLFLVLVLLIVVLLLIFILRAVKPILVSVFVILFSVIAAIAFSGMMGWKLTPFTASVPMIILILAVADCVHYITSFVHKLREGEEKRQALINALKLNFKPIAITSVTTAIGFLTLNFSESGSMRALGNQVAFGVMFAFVLSVTFLPAVLALLSFKVKTLNVKTINVNNSNRTLYANATEFLFKHKLTLLPMTILVPLVFGYCLTFNEFNDNLPTYFAKSLPWRQANDFSEKHFGGAYTFSYSVNAGQSDGITDPTFLKNTEKFVTWLRGLPEVSYVNSVTDTFKRLNKSLHGDDQTFYRLPDNKQLAAQYLLLYEMSLPYGLDLNDQVNLDKSATKVLVTFKSMSTTRTLQMEKDINNWIDSNLPGISAPGSGVQMMFAHLLDQDTRGLILGAGFGLLIISFLLILAFKSLKIGLISIAPNIFPAVIAFGIWGIFVGEIGMGMAMVSGMTIGIIVDDTVHFLSKYLTARRIEGFNAKASVEYAFKHVGPSIVFTTIVLLVGFITMAVMSEFKINSDMGKMTAIILTIALIFDLVSLPVLLMIFDNEKSFESQTKKALA